MGRDPAFIHSTRGPTGSLLVLTKEDLCNIVWTYQTDGARHIQLPTAMVQTWCNRSARGAITLTVQSSDETTAQPIGTTKTICDDNCDQCWGRETLRERERN